MLGILLRMAISLAHELVPDATTISTPPWPPLPPLGAQSEWKEGRWMRKEEQRQLAANKQILFFSDVGRRRTLSEAEPLVPRNLVDLFFYASSCRRGARDRQRDGEGQDDVKQLEDCSVANALGTWFFSVAGALIAIAVGIHKKSLAPLVFFGTTGTMLDIIVGISQCEGEQAERQMKLLETQKTQLCRQCFI
ncbi:unnamed protein product [Musa hybrid cultivar]